MNISSRISLFLSLFGKAYYDAYHSIKRCRTADLDAPIIGAGISGIGAARRLQRTRPDRSYAILEARSEIGGTWSLFRYPGIRSDSDMLTLGYAFRPWDSDKALGDGLAILEYLRDAAQEYGIDRQIRYGKKVIGAACSTSETRWTVTRPQHWPEDLDYADKRVVVIGSGNGATAVTLVSAIAGTAEHVTMLQHSPSYITSVPAKDPMADRVRCLLPCRAALGVLRWQDILYQAFVYQFSRRGPETVKIFLRRFLERQLPGFDLDRHFTPSCEP